MNTHLRKEGVFLAALEGCEGLKDAVHGSVCVAALQPGPLSVKDTQHGSGLQAGLKKNTQHAECVGVFLSFRNFTSAPK
jgi:hypothetical protein